MNRFLMPAVGLAIISALVGAMLFLNRGSRVVLNGEIKKVRTHAADEKSSVAILDFRFANPAKYPLVVRSVEVILDGRAAGSQPVEGTAIADMDARRFLDAYPDLGPKYNDSLKVRDRIPAGTADDRMIAARFEVPVEELERRKRFRIRVLDVDGAVSELAENVPAN